MSGEEIDNIEYYKCIKKLTYELYNKNVIA